MLALLHAGCEECLPAEVARCLDRAHVDPDAVEEAEAEEELQLCDDVCRCDRLRRGLACVPEICCNSTEADLRGRGACEGLGSCGFKLRLATEMMAAGARHLQGCDATNPCICNGPGKPGEVFCPNQ